MTQTTELWEEISTLIHDAVCGCTHGDAGDGAFVRNGDEVAKQVVELIKERDLRPVVKPLEWDGLISWPYEITVWEGTGTLHNHAKQEDGQAEILKSGFLSLISIDELKGIANDHHRKSIFAALDLAPVTPAPLSFEHLRQWGFAPGSYSCFCSDCGKQHEADKRAWRCLECAEAKTVTPAQAVDVLLPLVTDEVADELRAIAEGGA